VGVLHDACRARGMRSVSLWAPVPHYVAAPPNPKAQFALLDRLSVLLGLPIALDSVQVAANAWEQQITAATLADDEIAAYVRNLEESYDSSGGLSIQPDDDDWDGPWAEAEWSDDLDDDFDELDDLDDDDDDADEDAWLADGTNLPSGESLAADFERFLREHRDD
jgi:hypothetical protein